MSLFSSLTTAVSGLSAQSTRISNVSNNLANTTTTAYKAKGTSFEALVSASNSASGGVLASTEYENDVQGTITAFDVSTYMSLSGSGYFAVKTASKSADGSLTFSDQTYYTRRGDFTLDADGYLVNGSNYYLVGWNVNSTTDAVDTSSTSPIQISQLLDAPVATSTSEYAANLPASASAGTTTATSTISVYDSLGTSHDMSYYWVKNSDPTINNTWTLYTTIKGGYYDGTTYSDYTAATNYVFNSSGALDNTSITADAAGTAMGAGTTNSAATVSGTTPTSISFSVAFAGAGTQDITCAFANTTQYDDTQITVSTFSQNGIPRGSFSSVSIDTSGNMSINYDNGQAKTYYKVPIVLFNAQNSLKEVAGDAYSATIDSGSARFCAAGTLGAGTVSSKALEGSNVDIANEFSSLIVSQQVYSANAKTISTVNDMLSTLLNVR
jgi:flagellar hook protein FlgE